MPLAIWYVLTTIESFQMRYCTKFYVKGHQNCQKLKSKLRKKSFFSKLESLNMQLLAALMPLEEKLHTLLHLKALINA